jgi:subtilisin family serine protease
MRFAVTWLTALLIALPGFGLTGAERQSTTRSGEYDDHHLIVRFKPSMVIPPNQVVRAQGVWFDNKLLDELEARWALVQVERLAPDLPLPTGPMEAALRAVAQRAPQSLEEVAAILHKHGQDRSVLLRFAQPIDPPRLAQELMRRYPDLIEWAEPDYIEYPTVVPNDPRFDLQWHLQQLTSDPNRRADIHATEAWDLTTGSPTVVIAVIDAGVDVDHPDIANHIFVNPGEIPDNGIDDDGNGFVDDVSGWDFTRRDNDPEDETGHGSWMSGIAAAETNNALDTAGVSWGSRILPLKAGDGTRNIYTSFQIEAINYAMTMAPRGVRIINMSFGAPTSAPSQEREAALRAANEARIIAIAAAGNGGRDNLGDNNDQIPNYPSNHTLDLDNVVAVAATDRSNKLTSFSNFGRRTVDVGAPGEDILSLTSRDPGVWLGSVSGMYNGSGTSPATAIVSGITALIYSTFPDITPLQVKNRLRGCVDRAASLLTITISGGRVNAFRALERDEAAPAPITDLRVAKGSSPVTLAWTATGDDDRQGQATSYEIRYLTAPITASNVASAQKMTDVPFPQPAGTTETLRVPTGLSPGTYYFLIRVFDNVGNMAESNQLAVTIPG